MTSGGGASYCVATASSFLEKFAGIGDLAGHGRGGRSGRRAQIDGRLGVAHAPVEVAVGGAEADLAVGEDALVDADAGAAAGVGDHGAGVPEHVEQALGRRGSRHGLRGRCDDEARVGGAVSYTHLTLPTI